MLKAISVLLSLCFVSSLAIAEPWVDAPCFGTHCKLFVDSLDEGETSEVIVGQSYIYHNGAYPFDVFMSAQTAGPTMNEPVFDVDLFVYKWMKIDPNEEHNHFHLVAKSETRGNDGEHLEIPNGEGLYQLRVKKMSGKKGNLAVYVKFH